MEWVVCKDKETGKLFPVSRKMREYFIEMCMRKKIEIKSIVVKTFFNRNEAQNFCDRVNDIDNLLDGVL